MGMWTCDISRRSFDPTDAVHRDYRLCAIFWFIQIWHFYQTPCEATYRSACLKARPAHKQNKHTWHTCVPGSELLWRHHPAVARSSCRLPPGWSRQPSLPVTGREQGFVIFRKGYRGYALMKVWNQEMMCRACRLDGKKTSTYSLRTLKLDVKGLLGRPGRRRGYIRMDHKRLACEKDRAQRWALLKYKTLEIYKQNPVRRVFFRGR